MGEFEEYRCAVFRVLLISLPTGSSGFNFQSLKSVDAEALGAPLMEKR
jgi:hypothetical protein